MQQLSSSVALRVSVCVLLVVSTLLILAHEPSSQARQSPIGGPIGHRLLRGAVPSDAAPEALLPPLPALPALPVPLPVPVPALETEPPPASPQGTDGLAPYRGLATWVDVYDWSNTFARGAPTVHPGDVDTMAGVGVQTLFIQASKHDSPTHVLEADRLGQFIDRARANDIKVVAWYLPTLVDVGKDLARMRAIADVAGFDGLAVDIEARNVADPAERSRRVIELSGALRRALPGRTIGAVVMPPVQLEVVNTAYWPNFPYREIAPFYDTWMTMGYWSFRTSASGYRSAYNYTKENVIRLRRNLGQPDAPVHPIGGIGTGTTVADVEDYKRAISETGGFGGGLYDWSTTSSALWPALRPMRSR